MSENFKPGDVAMDSDYGIALVARPHFSGCPTAHADYGLHVHFADGDWGMLDSESLRRLVVIDPENRETFREPLEAWVRRTFGYTATPQDLDNFATELREFANPTPPKPDEPTGLGAVVEDTAGDKWVRHCYPTCEDGTACIPWRRVRDAETGCYRDINAVRVLSEGVQS